MSELRELYQELILDHGRKPRNFRAMDEAAQRAYGHNPLCGDQVVVYVRLRGDVVDDVSFQGQGCAISTASASLLTQALKGKSVAEAREIFEGFQGLVTGKADDAELQGRLGKLAVFAGVREFPIRVKCATLPWHTFQAAVHRKETEVTTE